MEPYNKVKLCTNKYQNEGVFKEDIGYIIEKYDDNNYEVEFSNSKTGETIALIVARKEDIELVE